MRNTTRRLLLLLFLNFTIVIAMAQQQKTFSGIVKDSTGFGVPGITVQVKGSKTATMTDTKGAFKISTSQANPTLLFTGVGFAPVEMAGGENLDVRMAASTTELNNVVVTSLGIKRSQKALGYATTTIKAEEITRTAPPNFAQALYGKAPGVRISSNPGGATSGVNIQIRGINSINGKSQPLIILDGIPIRDGNFKNNDYWSDQRIRGNGLLDMNPEDIENISILKGASAAALYGSDAVNGVVLITTKSAKGKKGFSVDANISYSQDEIAYLPRYQNIRGAGAPITVANVGQADDGFVYVDMDGNGSKETRGIANSSINFGPKFDGKPTLNWKGDIIPYSSQGNNSGYAGLFKTGTNASYNVSVSQAGENANTRFSLTRQENEGISQGSKNYKNIANLNTSLKLGKKFTTDLMVNYINGYVKDRPYMVDRMINNFTGMMGRFDNADWYFDRYKTSLGYRFVTGSNQSLTPDENIKYNGFKGDIGDYVWRVKESHSYELSDRVIASMTHNWQIANGLKLRGRLATDFTSEKTESTSPNEVPLAYGNSGSFGMGSSKYNILYGDVLATYTRKITSDLEMNIMAGYTATKEEYSALGRYTDGGLNPENKYDISASVNTAGSSSQRSELVKDAFMGTLNASYKGWLFAEATVRRDRTSTLNPGSNSFVYPSVNASLILSEAFKLPEFISYAKLRGSWGIVGNYTSPYAANIAYTQNTMGVLQTSGKPVLYNLVNTGNFGNLNLRPEEKHEYEFGAEAKFFKNRLGLDISYYNAQVVDQILNLSIPNSSGASAVLANVGTLRNTGLEIGLSGSPIVTKNFRWDATLNFAQNTNKLEKLNSGATELIHADFDGNAAVLKSVVGQPMGDFYTHPIAKDSKGNAIINDDGLYRLDDGLVKTGNAMPKAVGGFLNNFNYKGISLDVNIDYRFGGYVMPTGINWMISRGLLEESTKYMDEASGGLAYYVNAQGKGVQTTGTAGPNGEVVYHDGMLMQGVTGDGNPNTNVMSQAYYYWNTYNWGGPQYSSSRYELYVVKNSYIKMRELSLGYTLPAKWAKKISARNVTLSVFGRNLFYLYRTIKDMDAEQTTAGSQWQQQLTNAGTNPSTRSYGVMLRTSF
jgi:TonB-linked SusC/RagA family outer membrane protein